jgi:hypothetical protein
VEVDLSDKTGSVDGDTPAAALVSGNRNILLRRARYSLTDAGGGAGVLFLDELHLSDPVPSVDYGLLTSAWYRRDGSILSAGGLPLLGDFSWSGRSRVANPGFASGFSSADGRVYQVYQEADFSSLYSRAELSLNVKEGDDEAEVSGGHRLTIPEAGPLQIEDGYSHDPSGGEYSFTKRNALRLSLPKLKADANAEASYRGDYLSQNWNLSAEIEPTNQISFSPELSLANTVFDPGVGEYAYAGGWLQGTRLLAYAEEEEPNERSASGALPVKYRPDSRWGVEFLPEAGVRRYGSEPRKELDEISLALNLPFSLFPDQFRRLDLDLRYRRAFSGEWRTAGEAQESGFPGDITAWSSTAGRQPYLVGAAPFAEIFGTAAERDFAAGTAGFDAGGYSPSTGFTLQRRFSSRLSDLLLPSFLSFETGRNYSRELDALTSSFFTETLATMTAVNLFGSMGSYPLFSWYESDEISTSVTLSTIRDDEFSYGWQLENAVLLYGSSDERYSLKNSLSLNEEEGRPSWSAAASALWFGEPGVRLPPPLPAVLPDGTLPRLKHTEELSFTQKPLEGGSWQRNAGLKHATGVSYGEGGFIEAYIALGFNTTPLSGVDKNLSFYAFEAGIVGEFNF